MTNSSKKALMAFGGFNSKFKPPVSSSWASSATIPCACSINDHKCARRVRQSINWFVVSNDHRRNNLILHYSWGWVLLFGQYFVHHAIGFGFLSFHPIIAITVLVHLFHGLPRVFSDNLIQFVFEF